MNRKRPIGTQIIDLTIDCTDDDDEQTTVVGAMMNLTEKSQFVGSTKTNSTSTISTPTSSANTEAPPISASTRRKVSEMSKTELHHVCLQYQSADSSKRQQIRNSIDGFSEYICMYNCNNYLHNTTHHHNKELRVLTPWMAHIQGQFQPLPQLEQQSQQVGLPRLPLQKIRRPH